MKVYFSLFKIKLINIIQYRAAAYAGLATQIFFGLIFVMVYYAFYQTNATTNLPMNWQELISYTWLNQAFFALNYIWLADNNLIKMIKEGNVVYELCRPISFYKKWYSTMYGTKIAHVLVRSPLLFVFAFLIPAPFKLGLPISFEAFLIFIVAMIISSLLVTSMTMLIHLITFFTLDERGVTSFFQSIGQTLSGQIVPIAFFPFFLKKISDFLPFKFLVDVPYRIYTGNLPVSNALPDLILGLIWLVLLICLGFFLSHKVLNKAIIQGG